MARICPDCGRPKEDHALEGRVVRGPNGMEVIKQRVCPVVRRRGPTLPKQPQVFTTRPRT